MSKSMLVTPPCVMLLLDVWPLGRIGRRAVLEKLPLMALSIGACVMALWSQSNGSGMASLERIGMGERCLLTIYAYGQYLLMIVWPIDLIVFYSRPQQWSAGPIVAATVALIALSTAAIMLRRKQPAV